MAHPSALPVPVAGAARPTSIPLRDIAPWAAFVVLLALVLLYFVGAEEGATTILSSGFVHEFAHDGRHLLAFPCH